MLLLKVLDILRILIVSVTFFFGYQIGFADGYNPFALQYPEFPVLRVCFLENRPPGLKGMKLAAIISASQLSHYYPMRQSPFLCISPIGE